MALIPTAARSTESLIEKQEALMRSYFEPRLVALGLSADQLKTQSLDELNQSLVRLNDAIRNPESFGSLKMNLDAGVGLVIARTSAQFEIGVLPLLLERKKF